MGCSPRILADRSYIRSPFHYELRALEFRENKRLSKNKAFCYFSRFGTENQLEIVF